MHNKLHLSKTLQKQHILAQCIQKLLEQKNEEEIFFPGDSESFKLPMSSDSLKLVRRIRDEVHRFGITFHRNQRSKGTFKNELEQVPGIGKATIDELLRNFKSVKNIKLQSEQALAMVVGVNRATILTKYFKGKE